VEPELLVSKAYNTFRQITMLRTSTYSTGDRIHIHPKFAHLFPHDSAVIVGGQPDPFRPSVFSEYTVEFSDGTMASLFAFQIYEERQLVKE
jgi:hypothetical protein